MEKLIKIYAEDTNEFDDEPSYTEYIYELKRVRDISKEEYEYQKKNQMKDGLQKQISK